jgi:predicted N-acetyltransferase YhbS
MASALFSTDQKDLRLIKIAPLTAVDPDVVETLLDQAFGLDRKTRTAYLLRAGVDPLDSLSFAAMDDQHGVLGTIQCWPIALSDGSNGYTPMILVGPVAVSPAAQRRGIGKTLMQHMLTAAETAPPRALVMIGDPEYYGRFFGFYAAPTQGWDLPGPFERHRLLARLPKDTALPQHGIVVPDPAFATDRPSS